MPSMRRSTTIFNFIRDTTPVASIARTPLVMEVNPSFPASTVPEFISYAKANPGKINMATAGIGSSVHLSGELFMTMTGVQLVPVHYRTSYVPDMLAGQVQVVFSPVPTTIEQIRAGKLRALAVSSENVWTRCQTSRPSASLYRAMRQACGMA